MKKIIVFAFVIFGVFSGFAQSSVNGYKYVIVPKKFDFLKKENQYQVNALTKFLFEKYNFTTVYANNLTEEMEQNSCLALKADVRDDSNMFTTKLVVELTNCRGEVVFVSEEGKSKEKDYKAAYHDALRKAFLSVEELNYSYDPSLSIVSRRQVATSAPAQQVSAASSTSPVNEVPRNNQATEAAQNVRQRVETKVTAVNNANVLYAQPVDNGYQLVDSTPKVIFVLQNTSADNVFIIKDKNGMLMQKDGKWIAEYYKEGERVQEELNIKF
ncbi:hypothetical protein ED312_12530 [Sinomicrobium pectinilyticum]|uniref:DUF4468 domain-containing protein n=1 Tax=Sinomicrobium pectinilyticum TaxID=1084421 RepID=A0A3N0EC58_SINP1|nr:hypothetical protein [Sinomicrobium pectinilyticum]RNL85414.1 hypothetical protein ED312_12530 [Sinomicrobium pectinilyticum]